MAKQNRMPAIRFRGFVDPWEQRKLGDITVKIGSGKTPSGGKNAYVETGIPLIRSQNVNGDKVDFEDVVYIDEATDESMANSRVFTNDVLLNITGASIGRSAIYKGLEQANVNQHVCIIRPIEEFHPDFIQLNLTSDNGQKQIEASQAGGGREGLNFQEIGKMEFSFPQIDEQRKIGTYFNSIDRLITLHQRKYDKLVAIKKAMLEKMFPREGSRFPEIRFAGFAEPWEWRKLGDIGETYTGLSGKTKDDFGHGQARFVTYMNVFSNPISNPEMTEPIEIDPKQHEVEVGDVFFTTSSETPEEVGMSSVLLEKQGKTYLNSFCFGFRPSEKMDSYYLAYMLRSEPAREKIILLAQGISRYNISKNKVMEIAVSLPSLDEQKLIGQYFRQLDNLITLHQRKLEKLQAIKKSMLEKMFA